MQFLLPPPNQTDLCSSNVRSSCTFWLFPDSIPFVRHERVRSIRPQSRSRRGRDVATSVEQILLGNGHPGVFVSSCWVIARAPLHNSLVCSTLCGDAGSIVPHRHHQQRNATRIYARPSHRCSAHHACMARSIDLAVPSCACAPLIWPFHLHRHSSFMGAYAYLYGCLMILTAWACLPGWLNASAGAVAVV